MSNVPPPNQPPYGQPPQPYGQPPAYGQPQYGQPPAAYGMPPQGQPPYGYPPGGATAMPPPQGSNGWAIASLVTSLVGFCVPGAGLLGALFGFLGLGKAKKVNSGKGLAMAGLIIGLLTVAQWGVIGGSAWWGIQQTKPNRDMSAQFIKDLAAGKVDAAATVVDPTKIDSDDLSRLSGSAKGTVTDVTTFASGIQNINGVKTATLAGMITYSDGSKKSFTIEQRQINGQWKIETAIIQ